MTTDEKDREKALFLCAHNSCRSQMAKGFLRHLAGDRYDAHSAGLYPLPVDAMTAKVMDEEGIDVSGEKPTDISQYLGVDDWDHVVIVCEATERACPHVYPTIHERLVWPLPDPKLFQGTHEEKLQNFREVRDQIKKHVLDFIKTCGG